MDELPGIVWGKVAQELWLFQTAEIDRIPLRAVAVGADLAIQRLAFSSSPC